MQRESAPARLIRTNGFMRGSSTPLRPGTRPHRLDRAETEVAPGTKGTDY